MLPKVSQAKAQLLLSQVGFDQAARIEHDYKYRHERLEIELAVHEARRLFRLAKRWGVEGTPQQKIDDPNHTGDQSRRYFTPQNQEAFEGMIANARRKLITEWVAILSPIISVIISVLAFLISALALYLQATSDQIIILPPPD